MSKILNFILKLIRSVALVLMLFCLSQTLKAAPAETSAEPFTTVEDVMEDAGLKLSSGQTVRLSGVAFPGMETDSEYRDRGLVSSRDVVDYIRQLVAGKQVRLEYEGSRRDEDARPFANVFVVTSKRAQAKVNWPDDYVIMTSREFQEIFLNATLLRAGYVRITNTFSDGKYQDLFEKIQAGAREKRRGMWAQEKKG
jgi:endonuclease YncB( thermonuclease family)